ncbi:MAG: hypothetical protein JSV69_11920 [Chloroflexota bacterium]|nr:MAG: hypothetical protein JSV69_11920 [Chloroflexota bacterium]UCF26989.1 MAG: hypothetical protein JSW42_10090 [Chloroflexota bacterium]
MSKRRKRKSTSQPVAYQAAKSGADSSARKLPDNFNPDYTYVKQDLRTIGILAGIFITILVILSFIL